MRNIRAVEKTVIKALGVLEALSRSDRPRGVSELGRELGLTKSNVHRLLDTLRHAGYVNQVRDGGAFELSLKMWHVGSRMTARLDVKATALPYLRQLRDVTQETARLTVLHADQGICIEQVETQLPMRIQTPIGGSLLLYCSATGKAMLAFQSEAFIDAIAQTLRRFTPATISNRASLIAELEQIRRSGFALNRSERMAGVCGVAAPVADKSGAVFAAIGISGPAERLTYRALRNFGPFVRDVAGRLSHDLGAAPDGTRPAAPARGRNGGRLSGRVAAGRSARPGPPRD
jgi:DNA-binding IclR family transcriptional regulator